MSKPQTKIDARMLEMMDYWTQKTGSHQKDWCAKIGYEYTNISNVRRGVQSFRVQHIEAAGKLIKNLNYNWLFGTEPNMIRINGKEKPEQLLETALQMLKNK